MPLPGSLRWRTFIPLVDFRLPGLQFQFLYHHFLEKKNKIAHDFTTHSEECNSNRVKTMAAAVPYHSCSCAFSFSSFYIKKIGRCSIYSWASDFVLLNLFLESVLVDKALLFFSNFCHIFKASSAALTGTSHNVSMSCYFLFYVFSSVVEFTQHFGFLNYVFVLVIYLQECAWAKG